MLMVEEVREDSHKNLLRAKKCGAQIKTRRRAVLQARLRSSFSAGFVGP
jgi:hypothetical protein